ncbi:hypothetical protein GYMLUDRAFT_45397 [Collybiopsis luxurians FD-317 M1]|uniref:Zn(2)-C6 fungal-type domain-containing protein n=1 Tax=Collybiopsis luxurians FD-317 M1 TaxID=944289 RepID=A0A0D0C6P5_9AGAR|nr:hypothetical protein GYMLUDRAFT_45397 [Collybiopsis luxurians FD-317 M1]
MGATGKEKDKDGKGAIGKRKPGRIPTSCAECRRLKLRCDKQVPCGKCVSRGCAAICPDGSLTAGKGNRLVLANTEQLHERIEQLCSRIRELENALRAAQAQLSDEEHPLLRSELLGLKSPHAAYPAGGPAPQTSFVSVADNVDPSASVDTISPPKKPEDENLIDAFGTLSIRENGETHFLGQTARSEYLIRALAKPQKFFIYASGTRLSPKIIQGAHFCPDGDYDGSPFQRNSELGKEIFSLLPPLSEAIRLCELYLEHGKYMYTPLLRTELFDDILYCIYRSDSFDRLECYHSLSLLFAIFALASLFNPDLPSCSIQAQEYFFLSKAALGFSPPQSHTTLKSIWCTVHLAQFLEFSDWEAMGSTAGWSFVGHAVRMGSSIGLHLNSSRWKLPDDIQQMRYRLFWTLFTTDTWSSFHYGRPPSLSHAYIDCPFPKDTEEFINADGERETGFHFWSWQFTAFMHSVMEQIFGSSRPAYNTVIDFDRKIRDFPIPKNLRIKCDDLESRPEVYMQRLIILTYKENTLMHLHRAYFAQALQDSPDDLTAHKYLASVIATYRSAWRLSKTVQFAWKSIPQLLGRYHLAWSQVLSAAIVMCILVTRAPNSKMTKSSVDELEAMAFLFEEAARTSRSAANILDTMRSLHRKAREAAASVSSPNGTITSSGSPAESSSPGSGSEQAAKGHSPSCNAFFTNTADLDETQDLPLSTFELDRLGGKTHLITACRKPKPQERNDRPATASTDSQPALPSLSFTQVQSDPSEPNFDQPSTSLHQGPYTQQHPFTAQNLHPTIARDIRNIDLDLGGMEFHFFDPPAEMQAEIHKAFGLQSNPGQASSPQQGERSDHLQSEHNRLFSSVGASLPTEQHLTSGHSLSHPHSDPAMAGMADVHFGDMSMEPDMHINLDSMGDMSDVGPVGAMFGNNSMFSSQSSTGAFSGLGHSQTNTQLPLPFGAPILDATWQSFVEQLGF